MTKYMQINDPTADERCFMVILTFTFILITHQTKPQPALSNLSSMDIKPVVERGNILNLPSLSMALQCCIASYYIYNIAYPANMESFMLF